MAAGRPRRQERRRRSSSSTGSCAPTATCAGCSTAASSSTAPAGGCGWTARSSTSPSAARPRRRCAGARSRRPARRSCARRAPGSSRPPTRARRKIERDLHDGAQQRLVTLALDVRVARSRLETDPESAGPFLDRLGQELSRGLGGAARARARHPPRGADRARPRPADRGARRARAGAGRGRRAARRAAPGRGRGDRVLHGLRGADQRRQVRARDARDRPARAARTTSSSSRSATTASAAPRASTGSGLSGLADRVGAIDGSLSVTSPPGEGTLVRAVLPLHGSVPRRRSGHDARVVRRRARRERPHAPARGGRAPSASPCSATASAPPARRAGRCRSRSGTARRRAARGHR